MPLDWLNMPLDASVGELIARGRRSRAIEALRARLSGRFAPSPEIRLQLVDLLVEAERAGEAVPILLGLADEFAKDGFVAKAVAALKRIEVLEPGRGDVEARLAQLSHEQHEAEPELEVAPEPPAAEGDVFDEEFAVEPLPPESFPPGFADPLVEGELVDATLEAAEEVLEVVPEPAPREISEAAFREQLLDIAETVVHQPPAPRPVAQERARVLAHAERLLASVLFRDLTEEELLTVVRGLRLLRFEAGEIVVLEGERSEGLFIVATGAVKVFIRSPTGRDVAVARLPAGEFFGEIASLSGRARSATVTAAAHTELLVLDAPALQALTQRYPRIGRILEDSYVERASSPDVAAVRSVRLADPELRRRAGAVLASHFGQSRWDPRMKLRLSDLLLRTGKEDDALAVLVGLADDFSREGFPEKAVAVLRKIERIRKRHVEEVSLAPLIHVMDAEDEAVSAPAASRFGRRPGVATDEFFQAWVVDVLRDRLHGATAEPLHGYSPSLHASPLFEGLEERALVSLIRGLQLRIVEPGDVLITEGEPADSLFVLASGAVRVFVGTGPGGGARPIATLGAGAFFGEIGALSSRPRIATVVAAARCELLELDQAALDRISTAHPRMRAVLEDVAAARSEARARLGERE
jgi:CRP-like cAMP-binding protein